MPVIPKIKALADTVAVEMLPGVERRTLLWGDKALACTVTIKTGSEVPTHSHVHEQIEYVLTGDIEYTVDGEKYRFGPGTAICIPGGVLHSAVAHDEATVYAIFAPVREEYK